MSMRWIDQSSVQWLSRLNERLFMLLLLLLSPPCSPGSSPLGSSINHGMVRRSSKGAGEMAGPAGNSRNPGRRSDDLMMPMTSHDEERERDHEPRRSAGADLAEAHLTAYPTLSSFLVKPSSYRPTFKLSMCCPLLHNPFFFSSSTIHLVQAHTSITLNLSPMIF